MIVLDTHVLLWWLSEPRHLSATAREAIDRSLDAADPLFASSISAWEIAMLVERGRLELTKPLGAWLALAESLPELDFVPVGNRIAARSVQLPNFPNRDPADRMIAATALELGASLLTADTSLHSYPAIDTIWD